MTEQHICPLAKFSKHKTDDYHCNQQCGASIAVQARYEAANIPDGYRNIYLDNSPVRDNQEKIYKALDAYMKTFIQEDVQIKNLYLSSKSPGTGKTTTSIVILNEWIRRRFLYFAKKGETIPEVLGLFMDVTEFQNRYNMATLSNDDEEMARIASDIRKYSEAPFLVVDDLGVRSATEAFRGYLHTIINARVSRGKPTVYTSNEQIDSLKTIFDARLYDRVRDQTLEMSFSGGSKRGRRTT